MKRIIHIVMAFAAVLSAEAGEYAYLNIIKTDGTGVSLPATRLTITYTASSMVSNGMEIPLTELSMMYFSNDLLSSADDDTTQTEKIIGDVDGNGVVDENDVEALADIIMTPNTPNNSYSGADINTSGQISVADINGDQQVNVADLTALIGIVREQE